MACVYTVADWCLSNSRPWQSWKDTVQVTLNEAYAICSLCEICWVQIYSKERILWSLLSYHLLFCRCLYTGYYRFFLFFFLKVPTCSYPTKATERSVTGFYSEAGELGSIFPLKYLRGKKSILTMATKFPLSHIQELISIFFVGI